MPRSGALAAAAGPKGKGSGGAMQGRPLRCQHGRRWSQSARARWCCISWRSGGRLAVPGPKSDRAAPSWRGWVAQKSAAHHAMVPMQLNKHCHSRDLAERWRLAYCIILWPLYSLRNGQRPRMCRILVGGPLCPLLEPPDADTINSILQSMAVALTIVRVWATVTYSNAG
jgi:hypothetical protein